MNIRQAQEKDVSRIAEILVYNNRVNFFRVNFFPIFKDEDYSFGKLQVMSVADEYLRDKERLQNTFIFDDGVIRGFIQLSGREIQKLYVDTFFQNMGIGAALISLEEYRSSPVLRKAWLPPDRRTDTGGRNQGISGKIGEIGRYV